MQKQQLENYYYSHSIHECLAHFQISRRTLFIQLEKAGIPKKKNLTSFQKWQISLPDDLESDNGKSYLKKWEKEKGKPLEWWANQNESEEERYIIRKNYLIDNEKSKKEIQEEIKAENEVNKCLHI